MASRYCQSGGETYPPDDQYTLAIEQGSRSMADTNWRSGRETSLPNGHYIPAIGRRDLV
jgi:hypothetical protein